MVPGDRPPVRMPGEHQPAQLPGRHRLRLLLRAAQAPLDVGHLARELVGSEGRLQQHLGEQVQPEREVLLEHRERDGGPVAARAGLEAAPHELDRAIHLRAGPPRGAAREQRGGEVGHTQRVRRIVHRSGGHAHAHHHDGDRGSLGHQQHRPVRQDLAVGQRARRLGGAGEQEQQQGQDHSHGRLSRQSSCLRNLSTARENTTVPKITSGTSEGHRYSKPTPLRMIPRTIFRK